MAIVVAINSLIGKSVNNSIECASLYEEVQHWRAPLHVHSDDPLGRQHDAHVHAALEEVHRVEVVVVAGHQVRRRVAGNRRLKAKLFPPLKNS